MDEKKKKKKNAPKETKPAEPEVQEEVLQAEEAETVVEEPQMEQPQAQPEESEAEKLLKEALDKQEEYLCMAQRVQADFENYRRRNQNLRKESYDDGTRAFATTLLPVIDNLERAIQAAQGSPDESLKSGVELVYRQLTEAFEKRGIKAIDRLGQPFDPSLENAVMQGSAEEGEPGTVCAVFQKGYELEGKLLRAAMVKVVAE